MLNKVTEADFQRLIPISLGLSPLFMNITSKIMKAKPVYYIYTNDYHPIVALALFEKDNCIEVANHYPYYSGIWIKNMQNISHQKALNESLKFLNKKYDSITFNLPREIKDVRCFLWNDYKLKIKYTYVKSTLTEDFQRNVFKNYSKANKESNLIFQPTSLSEDDWFYHQEQLKSVGFSLSKLSRLKNWIIALERVQLIKVFSITNAEHVFLGSGIIILDSYSKSAGFLLSYVPKGELQSQVNAFLYVELHRWLKENGFLSFDYLGANNLRIADFKSRFNPELDSFFVVSYHRKSLKNRLNAIIFFLKRIKLN
ncbi:hypothetical protein [Pedobacter cryophilus]|uniref:BioF2-like acetyltransferase domain-containing protein n=1 Tax=Pedobacter cryophilus TaxID=2571271 RepID=A0A4U1BU16_9SPHI|nr:hypothetical protein [Pedobacter cryophilus]TKB96065.1 hypothetical protein FA046_15480 [Pedobacter cryophilus]